MKHVLEQYVQAVIAVIVAIVIFLMFFEIEIEKNVGVSSVFGKLLEQELSNELMSYRNQEFQKFHKSYTPVIMVKDYYVMLEGKQIRPEECFCAVTEGEMQSAVRIDGVWKVDGTKMEVDYMEDGSFSFEEAGVYWMSLSASDEHGYGRQVFAKVFVNGGIDG